ncbi:ABC transporter permease [Siminovitchia terrae]|uniref:ABC transporter permease n=1 Tax=Siminovitchia terrae TaxID=1914933 RepID=UPI0028B0C515|nr:ABC transporter permease [Siminovitchia terrae]
MSVLKNNYYRMKSKKYYLMISIAMTMISIFSAVYFHAKLEVKGSIAVVTTNKDTVFQSDYFTFTILDKELPRYQLMLGKYDGEIIEKGDGEFEIVTIKNHDVRKILEEIVKKPYGYTPPLPDARGIGTNILGFLILFILLQCVLFMFMLAEDMERKQIERMAVAPISFFSYVLSHFIFTFALVFIPAFSILAVMKGFGFAMGFSLWQYALLLALLCMLGIAFSMFLISLVKVSDTANMIGSSIVTLTTILSGSFYSFEKGNKMLEKIIWVLPQKDYLSFVQGLESGKAVSAMLPQLSYCLVILLVFFTFSVIKIKNDYVLRKD